MNQQRDFFNDIGELTFKSLTYTLFNIIDEDYFVDKLNKLDNTIHSIDDFVYAMYPLTDKERLLVRMWNNDYTQSIKDLMQKLSSQTRAKVYVNRENGLIALIKLKDIQLNNEIVL